ncbi:SPFH domain-containing protein [Phytoactinopolyspora halotolerans]|uniref:Band 7 domain-containing protein n=1 Tax=Phytoactinopolyspora halotolerans TaxID=1981512 RepID=A0A6L9SDV7_9ACTN|nr:SPFH domain-containing protein [Phytoactinopolyspora halotolerans]NEE03585.1 hypothetical protein [Phytoactinopolyspora halotolerans]
MAHITRYPSLRHLRSTATSHVRLHRKGKLIREGAGQAFWFRPLAAALSEVPIDDREVPLLFHARSADFQDVTVQATVTYRVTDPGLAASRIDFSIDTESGLWTGTPLEQVAGLLTESSQQHALDLLARMPLRTALTEGVEAVRNRLAEGLRADHRLTETGLAVLDVRVVAVRPEPDVEKALQTPAREQMQQDADRATYERRALAVERERTISENELQSKIELARREQDLVAQRGANARREAEETAAADRIEVEAQASRERQLADVRADATRIIGEAEAAVESARVAAYRDLNGTTLLGLAVKDLAGHLPDIGTVILTPDMLAPALARLAGER